MKVLIADDHAIVRQGLASLLARQDGMEIVGEADDGEKAVRLALELSPDLAILDVGMPHLNGIDAARQILAARPQVKVIILSMHVDDTIVSEAMKAGCVGYIVKSCLLEEIDAAIEAVKRNERFLSPRAASVVVKNLVAATSPESVQTRSGLTARERQVLQLVAEGQSSKQVAQRLGLSLKAVEAIRHRIKNKLHLDSVAELTKWAISEGLTSVQF